MRNNIDKARFTEEFRDEEVIIHSDQGSQFGSNESILQINKLYPS